MRSLFEVEIWSVTGRAVQYDPSTGSLRRRPSSGESAAFGLKVTTQISRFSSWCFGGRLCRRITPAASCGAGRK